MAGSGLPAGPTGTKLSVNVLEYGAVADRTTDCSEAFRKAIDDLHPALGGTVVVPAAPDWYRFDRSVIVDRDNVRIVGENPTTTVLESVSAIPPLIFGVQRGKRYRPMNPAHWEDLFKMLDEAAAPTAGKRWGYRTKVPLLPQATAPDTADASGDPLATADTATVTFPCSPFAMGPARDRTGWAGLRQLTLDFIVRNNAMPWGQDRQLFGAVDLAGLPAPFHVHVSPQGAEALVVFTFRTDDGLVREIRLPFDAGLSLLRCSLQLDLHTGAVAGWIDHEQKTPDMSLINDGWLPKERPPGKELALTANWYSPFNLGSLSFQSFSWGGVGQLPGGEVDLTFGALRLSSVTQYLDPGVDSKKPQQSAAGPVTDLDWLTAKPGVFACLPMNQPAHTDARGIPDLQVPWDGEVGQGFGLFIATDLYPQDTVGGNTLEKVTVNCGRLSSRPPDDNYGQAVGLGIVYGFTLDDVIVNGGAQGLSSYNFGANYPVTLRSCLFTYQSDAAIYAYGQNGRGDSVQIKAHRRSAFKAVYSHIAYRDVFVATENRCEAVVRLDHCTGHLDNWQFDFESGVLYPSDSYIWANLAQDIGGPTQLTITDCQAGLAGPDAVAVRLVSGDINGGLAHSGRRPGWCQLERSFNQGLYRGLLAVVAVDGPLWQGTYTGLPPTRPELVVTTASPGASARFGVGSVPPALTVPRPPGAGDPILGLPGLLGYYQADTQLGGATADGRPVLRLTDSRETGNHGTLVKTPAIYERDMVNGRAALRFTGGSYVFPDMRGTTGAVTLFLVTRGRPVLDTAPGRSGGIFQRGGLWQRGSTLSGVAVQSDTDWAVYTVRYTAGPKRVLDLWANGRRHESRRRDNAGDAEIAAPVLGSFNNGEDTFTGLLATAVIIDGALSDEQVDTVTRFLLHHHQIPV